MRNTLLLLLAVTCLGTACTKATRTDNRLTRGFGIWNIEKMQTISFGNDGVETVVSATFDEAYWRFYLGPQSIHICEVYALNDGEEFISLPVFAHDDHRLSLYDGGTEYTYTIDHFTRSKLHLSRYAYDSNSGITTKTHIELAYCRDCTLRPIDQGLEENGI